MTANCLDTFWVLESVLKINCQEPTLELGGDSQDPATATEMPAEAFAMCSQSINCCAVQRVKFSGMSVSFHLFYSLILSLSCSLLLKTVTGCVCEVKTRQAVQ